MFLDSFDPRPLGGAKLLELWSTGATSTAPERARAILRAAFPPEVNERLDSLPLGEWNAGLLRVRRLQFGETFVLIDRCPHCDKPVELRITGDALRPTTPTAASSSSAPDWTLETGGYRLRCRLLTGGDWREAVQDRPGNAYDAGLHLLSRAIVDVRRNDTAVALADIPNETWEALGAALAEADPWSEIVFSLHCPHCAKDWESLLEPGDYVWHEIAGVAQQSLRQVHRLASAYGWTESEVLDLPTSRRAAYVAMLDEELGFATPSAASRFTAPAR